MPVRSLFAAAAIASLLPQAEGIAGEDSTVLLSWTKKIASPAVCLGRSGWYLTVVPEGIDLEGLEGPSLSRKKNPIDWKITYLDPSSRLCLLETEASTAPTPMLELCDGPCPKPGETLSCRRAGGSCLTTVVGKDRSYLGTDFDFPLLRVRVEDAEHFRAPGTPLFNGEGKLVGLLTERTLTSPREAHAIPAAHLRKILHEYGNFQRSGPVWVGLVFHSMSTTPEVLEVRPDSPAAKAGVEAGDVVISVAGTEIEDIDELVDEIHLLPAEKEAKVTVLRGLDQVEVTLVPQFADHASALR